MSSEEIGLAPDQRIDNGLNSPLVFQDDPLRYSCAAPQRRVGDPGSKTRELGGFIDEKMFSVDRDRFFAAQGLEFRRNIFGDCSDQRNPPDARNWNGNGSTATPSGDDSDGEDDEDDEEDDDDDDEDVEGGVDVERLIGVNDSSKGDSNPNSINDININIISGGNLASASDGISNGKDQHHSTYGSGREVLGKNGEIGPSQNNSRGNDEDNQQERLDKSQSAVTIAQTDCEEYYYLQGTEGSASVQKTVAGDNGCGFSGRKDVIYSSESVESLRAVLSDPITGTLMDDAMILPCGHSFGGGGIQHVIRMVGSKPSKAIIFGLIFSVPSQLKNIISNGAGNLDLFSCVYGSTRLNGMMTFKATRLLCWNK